MQDLLHLHRVTKDADHLEGATRAGRAVAAKLADASPSARKGSGPRESDPSDAELNVSARRSGLPSSSASCKSWDIVR